MQRGFLHSLPSDVYTIHFKLQMLKGTSEMEEEIQMKLKFLFQILIENS